MSSGQLIQARQFATEGKYAEAMGIYQVLIADTPDCVAYYLELSSCLIGLEQIDEALVVLKQGMHYPDVNLDAACYLQLAHIYLLQKRYDLAAPLFEDAISKNARDLKVYIGLSNLYLQTGFPHKAMDILALAPRELQHLDAYILNTSLAMFQARQVDEALKLILDHIKDHPVHRELLSNALMFASYTLKHDHYYDQLTPYLSSCYSQPVRRLFNQSQNQRLRVGFVSGDFRMHPVGYFLKSFFPELKKYIDIYLYNNASLEDYVTQDLKNSAVRQVFIADLDTQAATEQILNDQIDILIDLSGHTAGNRLDIFQSRAAPYQLSYLGFPDSTQLSEMDGLITDDTHVRGADLHHYSEKIWYLPNSRFCFSPAISVQNISDAPYGKNHYLTLGNFGNPAKISDECANHWAHILLAIPNARLKLKHQFWEDQPLKKSLLDVFVNMGVEPGRVEFYGASKYDGYLQSYADIDVMLDTFPFTGGTTTCEALWMGVPVVTMEGPFSASRQTASLLRAIDEKQWIAPDLAGLIQIIQGLVTSPEQLKTFKATIREKIQKSSLGDGQLFAKNFYHILNDIKQQFLA